jgi:hypothetical protein
MGLFSATAPLIAVLHDDLFTGTVTGYMDRTGTIEMTSAVDSAVRCLGSFRYTGSKSGDGSVQCSDGADGHFQFNAISMLSGYGLGKTQRGPVSFTYGLTAEESQRYLLLPQGKRLEKKSAAGPLTVL